MSASPEQRWTPSGDSLRLARPCICRPTTRNRPIALRAGGSLLSGVVYIFSSFCRQRAIFSSGGIGVSAKLVFQSVTPTSPT
jgi:hypothetical protein